MEKYFTVGLRYQPDRYTRTIYVLLKSTDQNVGLARDLMEMLKALREQESKFGNMDIASIEEADVELWEHEVARSDDQFWRFPHEDRDFFDEASGRWFAGARELSQSGWHKYPLTQPADAEL